MIFTQRLDVDEWLGNFAEETLDGLVMPGGAAIRFATGDAPALEHLVSGLASAAAERRLLTRFLHPSDLNANGKPVKLHQMEDFYRQCVSDFDWLATIDLQLRVHLRSLGLEVGPDRELSDLDAIASDNGRDMAHLVGEIQKGYVTQLVREPTMLTEYRRALSALSADRLLLTPKTPSATDIILAWLNGGYLQGGASYLKSIGIYDKLRNTNARNMFISLLRWMRRCGFPGLIVVLDFRPYQAKKLTKAQFRANQERRVLEMLGQHAPHEDIQAVWEEVPSQSGVFFGDKQYTAMLDFLRHFIDDIESFPGFSLVVLTSDEFYDVASPRNFRDYDALQTRIGQEVRLAKVANPAAALVPLEVRS